MVIRIWVGGMGRELPLYTGREFHKYAVQISFDVTHSGGIGNNALIVPAVFSPLQSLLILGIWLVMDSINCAGFQWKTC